VRRWDLSSGSELGAATTHRAPLRALAIGVDGRTLVSGGDDGAIHATDVATGAVTTIETHPGGVSALATGPDPAVVASGGGDRSIRLWDRDRDTSRPPLRGHTGGVRTLAVSDDGQLVISGGDDRQLRVWDLATGSPVAVAGALAITPGDTTVVVGGHDGAIQLWSWEPASPGSATRAAPLADHGARVSALTVTTDHILSGGEDGTIRVWDRIRGAQIAGTGFDAPPPAPPRPGVVSDLESPVDLLDFRQDVHTLAALIADRGTEPPLAIALLGPWGRASPASCASCTTESRCSPTGRGTTPGAASTRRRCVRSGSTPGTTAATTCGSASSITSSPTWPTRRRRPTRVGSASSATSFAATSPSCASDATGSTIIDDLRAVCEHLAVTAPGTAAR
jgi:WD40 repeat protein